MVAGFSIPDVSTVMHLQDAIINTNLVIPHHAAETVTATAKTASAATAFGLTPSNLLDSYKELLKLHPLPTKMLTGATLAVTGDAIAQKSAAAKAKDENDGEIVEYDTSRAVSFAVFDMAYRALQHFSFPIIVAACQGQFIGSLPLVGSFVSTSQSAAMEQTLASQLGIVPFLYYPAFFALTGAIQGLDFDAAVVRARENFIPLMKRNLLFWIPVQYVQFSSIPEELQIPFLSVCGLAWTFILSVAAGSAKTYNKNDDSTESVPDNQDSAATLVATATLSTDEQQQLAAVAAAVVLQEADQLTQQRENPTTAAAESIADAVAV
eukprot:CAMPEP_0113473280 /NCGR_PEP_ID=MMETSP0014_2-20120614/17964_1 /TAXON_ID=2857 /ORGANISM="Nitzschia sp." /LENGTH=322 /DNA_ID=CAMNT_0000366045 /DNA_START=284 /DNA_END=1252 /DNA_ORIENTATION=+ /assembly_acc=CAM_ASM_000159